jgi:hypothetical protein
MDSLSSLSPSVSHYADLSYLNEEAEVNLEELDDKTNHSGFLGLVGLLHRWFIKFAKIIVDKYYAFLVPEQIELYRITIIDQSCSNYGPV